MHIYQVVDPEDEAEYFATKAEAHEYARDLQLALSDDEKAQMYRITVDKKGRELVVACLRDEKWQAKSEFVREYKPRY